MPENEKDDMDNTMKTNGIRNRTEFIRSSIKSFCEYLKSKREAK